MLYWEAKRRFERLRQFREEVVTYYARAHWDPWDQEFDEDQEASAARRRINEQLSDATWACQRVGVTTTIFYSPPPAVGGLQGNIDLFTNIFRLPAFDLDGRAVLDPVDRALGIYQRRLPKLWWVLFNPFYWMSEGIAFVGSIPFRLARRAGFDVTKAETSLWGKLAKAILSGITGLSVTLGILEKLGLLAPIVNAVKRLANL